VASKSGDPSGLHVVVVGGGVAGLVSALELANKGVKVTLLERAAKVGGKMRQVEIDGQGIDVGPTVLTMRWVFDNVFRDLGLSLEDHVKLVPAEVIGRHAWQDGARLDLFTDQERSARSIQELAGAKAAKGFRKFCDYAHKIYDATEQPFILSQRPDFLSVVGKMGLKGMAKMTRIDMLRSMWKALGDFFKDQRLHQLFGRYATYYGSSPYMAPATLNLIAHVELQGVWLVDGGMIRLAETFAALGQERGVDIRCDAEVERLLVKDGEVRGVRLKDGEEVAADAVVINADVAAVAKGHFGPEAAEHYRAPEVSERSLSALTLALNVRTKGFPLLRHNVFFSNNYEDEFERIFDQRVLPAQPTVYICAQDRDASESVIDGPERMFFILNAPAIGDQRELDASEVKACTEQAFLVLNRCGLEVEQDSARIVTTTPNDFERSFPATGGALYGSATHSWKGPMNRSAGRSPLPGLYMAGGSVHPGAGVPMVTMGGRLAAAAVLEDRTTTGLPPVTVTSGR